MQFLYEYAKCHIGERRVNILKVYYVYFDIIDTVVILYF